jgi:hypothetical protein
MNLTKNCLDLFEPDEQHTPQFVWKKDQSYEGAMIVLDNHLYERCKFVNCNFVYAGGPFGFRDCELSGGYLSPTGTAKRVLEIEQIFLENAKDTPQPLY